MSCSEQNRRKKRTMQGLFSHPFHKWPFLGPVIFLWVLYDLWFYFSSQLFYFSLSGTCSAAVLKQCIMVRSSYGDFPLHGTAQYGSLLGGGFPLGTVPGTVLVPLRLRFQASRTVTKTWRVNSADHWLAGENRHYCVIELATRDPPLQPYPLDLNQHSQRRSGRNFCLNKRTFLHQPQNSSVVVCWGSSDILLVDSRGADPARAWWRDAEGKSLMYNVTFELAIFSEYVFCLYFYLCICVLLQLKTIWSNKCTSRLY